MEANRHPILAQTDELLAALRALLSALPRPSRRAGEIERPRRRIRPLGTVSVPGSGDAQSMDERGGSLPNGAGDESAGGAASSGGNSGGGSGGAW